MTEVKKNIDVNEGYSSNTHDYFIVMGDIIKSSQYTYDELKTFRKVVDNINQDYDLISPLTITLGDEFQGIVESLTQAVEIILR